MGSFLPPTILTLDVILGRVRLFEARDDVSGGLARAVLGPGQDVAVLQNNGDGLLLDGAGLFESLLEDAHEELPLQEEVLEVPPLGLRDVLGPVAVVLGGGDEAVAVRSGTGDGLPTRWLLLLNGGHLVSSAILFSVVRNFLARLWCWFCVGFASQKSNVWLNNIAALLSSLPLYNWLKDTVAALLLSLAGWRYSLGMARWTRKRRREKHRADRQLEDTRRDYKFLPVRE